MVDEEIVTVKLRQINEYTNDLKEIRGFSREEYLDEMITQRAVERTLPNKIGKISQYSQENFHRLCPSTQQTRLRDYPTLAYGGSIPPVGFPLGGTNR